MTATLDSNVCVNMVQQYCDSAVWSALQVILADARNTDSPATKAQTLANSGNLDQIRKELTFGFAMGNEVKVNLQESARRHKEKKAIHTKW